MSSKKVVMMYDVQIQLQASGGSNDTQMCHRFINFETLDYEYSQEVISGLINDYLRILTQAEGNTAVLYSKSHSELSQGGGPGKIEGERSWTICIVFNPKRNKKVEQAIRA